MRPTLKAIRNADSEATLQEAWRRFQASFPQAQRLIAYIGTWMEPNKLAKWALYHREVKKYVLIPFVAVHALAIHLTVTSYFVFVTG